MPAVNRVPEFRTLVTPRMTTKGPPPVMSMTERYVTFAAVQWAADRANEIIKKDTIVTAKDLANALTSEALTLKEWLLSA